MSRLKQLAILAVIAPLAAGCAAGADLEATRNMTPAGSAYDKALYQEYLTLAQAEQDEGDVEDAAYFNAKAVAAAKGEKVLPQTLAERPIPNIKGSQFEAQNMRDMLLIAVEAGSDKKAPNHAARAQVMYDCWLETFQENIDKDEIARCRKGYDEAMKQVEAAVE